MTPVVLAFVEDPGAANGIAPLPAALERLGIDLRVVAAGTATAFLRDHRGVIAHDGAPAGALLDAHRPAAVLIGTSENPRTVGLSLVDEARARGIPSAGFVDAAPNAAHRFRGETSEPLSHVPDVVLVPDAHTRAAFVSLGLDEGRVVVCGHPHHDVVRDAAERLAREGRSAVRTRVLPGTPEDATVVVFAAEINGGFEEAQFRRSPAYTLHGRGARDARTQIVLEELIDAVRRRLPGAVLVLRLHPKNELADFDGLEREVDVVSRGGSPLDLVFAADLVCGMTTTLLTEAALLGRPTLSIVPREIEKDWLDSARDGTTRVVSTREALEAALTELRARAPEPAQGRPARAADRTATILAELVEQRAPERVGGRT